MKKCDTHLNGVPKVSFDVVYCLLYLFTLFAHTGLNNFIRKLDERNQKRLGKNTYRVRPRVYGEPRDVAPPETFLAGCWHPVFSKFLSLHQQAQSLP